MGAEGHGRIPAHVGAQAQVARQGDRFSLSCNTDITVDLLRARAAGTQDFLVAAEISDDLPFMAGTGEIAAPEIALLLDDPANIDAVLDEAKRLAAEGTAVCINVHLASSDFREGSISI